MYFQVIHRRVVRTIYTDYHILSHEWDESASFIHVAGAQARRARLQLVASMVQWVSGQLSSIIMEKETAKVEYTADDIVSAYNRLPPCPTLFGFIQRMAMKKAGIGRLGTAKTYRAVLASFARFRGGEDMTFDALDAETVSLYEAWLKGRGLKRNSSSCYLRTLRTLYRKAVEMGLATDKGIFRHVFTGFVKTCKRAVSVEALQAIRALDLPVGSPLAFARDMFMLSLYLQGMSFVDMAYMKKSDIRNRLLQYDRKKTGQTLTIMWEPPMQAIVDEYAHLAAGSPFLLPIIIRQDGTERQQYEKMEHNVNRNLKKIGEMAGLPITLTTYVARHSWASMMRNMGFDLSIISTGLGHESLRTTQIYLSTIDTEAVANANRKMIRRILNE